MRTEVTVSKAMYCSQDVVRKFASTILSVKGSESRKKEKNKELRISMT